MSNIKICSWNVNGLRAMLKKDKLQNLIDYDIICLQEVKIDFIPKELEDIFPEHKIYLNFAERKGYSGTMTLTKIKPITHFFMNNEGRITETEFKDFKVINCYFPQSNKRLEYKLRFCKCIKKMYETNKKPIIICGDINIAHQSIDIWKEPSIHVSGYTLEEREWYSSMLKSGFVDVYRSLHPSKKKYTWFDYRSNARENNRGWRIDSFLCKDIIAKKADILNIDGSDHLPITLII